MLPSGLAEHVSDDEPLARFLTSRSHYSSNGLKVGAFLPNPKDNETSVFRHGKEPRDQLWRIAGEAMGSRAVHGAAIVSASVVRGVGLELKAHEPPPRHANIVGWPSSADVLLNRGHAKEFALRLAAKAELVTV